MPSYTPIAGRGAWYVDDATGDIVLVIGDTVVFRVTDASAVTATTVAANLTGATSGAVAATTVASSGLTTTTAGIGAIGSDGTLVSEGGNSAVHVVEFTFSKVQAVAAAALSWGAELYTLPAVPCLILGASLDSTLAGTAEGSTPETGIGTTVGSGANATLDLVGAGAENIITGTAAAGAVGAGVAADIVSGPVLLPAVVAASSVLYGNVASTWDASEDITFAGTGRLSYVPLV